MRHHKDAIVRLQTIADNYITAGEGWWENQGLDLDSVPDWPGDSIMAVSWPQHVVSPRYNGDCTITGPYESIEEAIACCGENPDICL